MKVYFDSLIWIDWINMRMIYNVSMQVCKLLNDNWWQDTTVNFLLTNITTHLRVEEKFTPHGLWEHLVCCVGRHETQKLCTQYQHSNHRQEREHIHHLPIWLEAWQERTPLLQLLHVKGCNVSPIACRAESLNTWSYSVMFTLMIQTSGQTTLPVPAC